MAFETPNPVLVQQTRGEFVECVYRGSAAVVDASGRVLFSIGDISSPTFPRSSVKSVQSLPLVESGAADAFGFNEAELAITCASHSGETYHVELVQSMLKKVGLPESALGCGAHWPMGRLSERAMAAEGSTPTDLHNNCSGKHAGMLATCVHRGLSVEGYTSADHPLQQEIVSLLSELSGEDIEPSSYGFDGCSLPNWPMSVRGMAQVFARIASGEGLKETHAAGFKRLVAAGFAEPQAMGGELRMPTMVLSGLREKVYVKEGAQGVYCGALLRPGLGVAVKVDDGGRVPSEVIIANILAAFAGDLGDDGKVLGRYQQKTLRSWAGLDVGQISVGDELRDVLSSL